MLFASEPGRFRPRRRPALELGMTPLIDIVFLLLIFFMLTSRFVVQEGIQVDLPLTERGECNARRLTERLRGLTFARVFTSDSDFVGSTRSFRDLDTTTALVFAGYGI